MNRFHITLASLILFIFQVFLSPFALANTADAVGSIPGAFSVGTDGAANYHIPVALPPGINGLTPNLALEYDSQKNNGLVGVGWRLAGFPVISRCPTTLEKDGFIDGVDFDDNDKFCLNGQRLVAIKGAYGANGTEYRTEYDSYKKIISYGAVGNGPAYFKVWYKNGEIATFASNHDARLILKDHSEVLRWSLTAIEDRFRSMINYNYTTHADTGEQVPAKINYANTTIKFHYEAREDQQQTYLNGAPLSVTQRLNTIEIIHGEKSQRYILNYETTPVTHKSLLSSLQLCSTQCQPVTQLRWQFNETALNDQTTKRLNDLGTNHGWNVGQHPRYLRDVNGDGLTDIVAFGSGGAFTFLSSGTGFDTEPSTVSEFGTRQGWSTAKHPRHLADVNGDGKADIVGFADAGVYVSLSTGSGMAPATRWFADLGYGSGWHTDLHPRIVQDINGDGRADILAFGSGGAFVSYSTGTGFTPITTAVAEFGTRQGWSTAKHLRELADVNGDGLADIVGFADAGVYVSFNSHEGFLPAQRLLADLGYGSGWHTDQHPRFVRDMNGDGRADIVAFGSGGVFVSYSTGTGFTPVTTVVNEFGTRQGWQVHKNPRFLGDINNDGLDDIIGLANNGVYVSFNTGSGFSPARKILDNFAYSQGWTADKHPRSVYDFDGNGTTDFFGFAGDGLYTSLSPFTPPRLVGISNGFGHEVKLSYAPLTDKSIFTKSKGSQYPIKDIQPSTFVVSTVQTSNGIGGLSTTRYEYGELKYHQQGLGFLGFRTVTSTQEDTGIRTHSIYAQNVDARVIGALKNQKTYAKDGVVLKELQQSWLTHTLKDGDIPRYQTIMNRHFTAQRSLQDVQLSQTTQHLAYDAYGNVTESKTVTTDTYGQQQSTTTNTYQNDESNWLIGLATQTQATNVGVSGDSQTRTTQFSYDATTGALTQRIQEPGQGDYVLTTDFKYDSFGNLIEEQTQGAKVAARKQTYTYDAQGRFLTSTTNALGHKAQQTSDAFWGVPLTTTDANGLVTQYGYDEFGRLISQKAPDNTQTTLTRGWCDADTECPAGAVYWVKTQAQGSAPTTVYVDQLERTLRTETLALTGETQYQDTAYNALGQVEKSSLPYFKGDEVYWTTYEYDPLLRIVKTTQPDGTTSEVAYQGLNKVLTNAKGQTKTEHYNGAGQLVKVIDALGSTLSYTYDSFGNLTQTTDPDNNIVDLTYDVLGRKVAMNDPDKGAWTYEYDALGRLIRQQDAKGQVTKLSYDQLDRLIKQTENAQASSKLLWRVSEFQYDQQHKGLLDQVTVDGITQQYQYDNLGRLTSETQTLFGESFTLSYRYDQYSRPLQTTFPTGLTAQQTYNERGYLTAITDGKASNATTYWQAQAVDALGNITQQQYGNGATTLRVFDAKTGRLQDSGAYIGSTTQIEDLHFAYDELGNLTQREDKRQKIQETFAYDQLNRLTEVTAQLSGNSLTTSVQYDALGNITHKSDIGDYRYAGKCGSQQAGPHALTKTTGTQNATYCYDANGNMTSGNGRTVRYTAFDKPDQIIRGDYQIDLVYGPDQKRVRRIDQGPTGTSTTYYQSGVYEKVVSDTGKIQHKHYIADVAIITKTENAGTEDGTKTNYFHRDHLDSLTAITDQNGQVVERFSYDPWGKRRQTDWQAAIDFTQITSTITKRGFTNHEHLDGVGLIHMNGRVYDPNVGRFLSADPIIQFPDDLQSFNRYSYVRNNPLNAYDPTGFSECKTESSNNGGCGDSKGNNGGGRSRGSDRGRDKDTVIGYNGPLRPEYQPRREKTIGEKIADDVMDHYHEIGRGESNKIDGSDRNGGSRSCLVSGLYGAAEVFGYQAPSDEYRNAAPDSLRTDECYDNVANNTTIAGLAKGVNGVLRRKGVPGGKRRKNRILDKGKPGEVAWNDSKTTAKRYGPDGWVQKEFNKGHKHPSTPTVERTDHVHDYKPNPYHPDGKPDRQHGRKPRNKDYYEFNNPERNE